MDVRLILGNGSQKGRETPLARGVYLVGRSRTCQIRPKNRYVSRKHCAFIHKKRELLIQDLGSRTGTFVNGEKIEPSLAVVLKDGDRIRVGKTRFSIAIRTSATIKSRKSSLDHSTKQKRSKRVAVDERHDNEDLQLLEEDSDHSDSNVDASSPTEAKPTSAVIRDVEDVLNLLEDEDAAEQDSPSDINFNLGAVDVEEDDSEGVVDFAAPKSSESLDASQPLPSYALRQDWDVKGVYSWISQKEAFAKQDERRKKRKAKEPVSTSATEQPSETSQANAKTSATKRNASRKIDAAAAKWTDWIESDSVRPVLMALVAIAFAGWMIWNAWLLISFKG